MFQTNKHSTNLQVNSKTKRPVCMDGNHHQQPVSFYLRNLLINFLVYQDRISDKAGI